MKLKTYFILLFMLFIITCFRSILQAGYIGTNHIIIDKNDSDWTAVSGQYPTVDPQNINSAIVADHQFIWQDVKNDDHGDGDYAYPTQTNWDNPNSMDIDQLRICWDANNVYFYFRTWNGPDYADGNGWDHNAYIFGISTNLNTGRALFIQGDGVSINNGPRAELISSAIKPDFVFYHYGTYQNWLWNNVTEALLDTNVPSQDIYWNVIELGIPISYIGSPENRTWYIIMGSGQMDSSYIREVWNNTGQPSAELHGTGGDNYSSMDHADGVDPDIFDLIGASQAEQNSDLSSYFLSGTNGKTNYFADIQNSYVTIADYNCFILNKTSVTLGLSKEFTFSVLGANSTATGSFLGGTTTWAVYSNIGSINANGVFTANDNISHKNGFITAYRPGVTIATACIRLIDDISPAAVYDLTAAGQIKSIALSWQKPYASVTGSTLTNLEGIIIVRNKDHYPVNAADGTRIYQSLKQSYLDKPLIPGDKYYYTAIAYSVTEQTNFSPVTHSCRTWGIPLPANDSILIWNNLISIDNPQMKIWINNPEDSQSGMSVKIYSLSGKLIKNIAEANLADIRQPLIWEGEDDHGQKVPSGTYILYLKSSNLTERKRIYVVW